MSALLLVLLLVLVLINGLFVAAEFSLVRARRSRLEAMAREGVRGVETALVELDRLDEYLSACQVGITMASIGIGFLGEPAIASLIEPALEDSVSEGVSTAISFAIAFETRLRPRVTGALRMRNTARGPDRYRSVPSAWVMASIFGTCSPTEM